MATDTERLLKDAFTFTYQYAKYPKFREIMAERLAKSAQQPLIYEGRTLNQLIQALYSFSNSYAIYYRDILNRGGNFEVFFTLCYRNQEEFTRLHESIQPILTSEENQRYLPEYPQTPRRKPRYHSAPPSGGELTKEQRAAYQLIEKLRKYGKDFADSQKREQLIKQGIFSRNEAEAILKAGLVKGAQGGINREFKNYEEWYKAVFETAVSLLKDQEEEAEKITTAVAPQPKERVKQALTKEDKQMAAHSLAERIRKHGGEFVDPQKREELIKQGVFKKDEVEAILKAGLVKWAQGGLDREFKNSEEWDKAVFETAAGILEKQPTEPETFIKNGIPYIRDPLTGREFPAMTGGSQLLDTQAPQQIPVPPSFEAQEEIKTEVPAVFKQGFQDNNQPGEKNTRKLPFLKRPTLPSPIIEKAKDINSSFQILLRKILARYGANIASGAIGATLGYAGGGATGALIGGAAGSTLVPKFFQAGGGSPLASMANNTVNSPHLSNAINRARNAQRLMKGAKLVRALPILANPYVLGGIAVVILILLLFAIIPSFTRKSTPLLAPYEVQLAQTPGDSSSPDSPFPTSGDSRDGPTLGYFIPFRDNNITITNPEEIKRTILSSWPNARMENWETIVSRSIENGWNPAFVLTLWVEETGAQGVSSYSDPLGCDPSHPTTDINKSLNCLFNSFNNYTNDQFADFMCMYSESKKSPCVFSTNPNFPGNIKTWYSKINSSTLVVLPTPTLRPTQPPSVPTGQLAKILHWTTQISSALELGSYMGPGMEKPAYNRMVKDITNGSYAAVIREGITDGVNQKGLYWCTNIIIDSYNLSGIGGLGPTHQAVRNMAEFWKNTQGYNFIEYGEDKKTDALRSINPGYAFFMIGQYYGSDHASIIYDKQIDEKGNGFIITTDSNASEKRFRFPVENWEVKNTFQPLVGFGGISK